MGLKPSDIGNSSMGHLGYKGLFLCFLDIYSLSANALHIHMGMCTRLSDENYHCTRIRKFSSVGERKVATDESLALPTLHLLTPLHVLHRQNLCSVMSLFL